jgi:hypothetical protein
VALDATRIDAALLAFDSAPIEQELWRINTAVPSLDLVRDVLLPALAGVGDRWNQAPGGIAHEHLMSAMLRNLTDRELKRIVRDLPPKVELWTGGAGTAEYESLLGAHGQVFNDLDAYGAQLSRVGARLD